MKNTVKNILSLLMIFTLIFNVFIGLIWRCSAYYFKPYGNDTVKLSDVILTDDFSDADDINSNDSIYLFLKEASFKSVGLFTEKWIVNHYEKNEYQTFFFRKGSEPNKRDNLVFQSSDVICNGKDIYMLCRYFILQDDEDIIPFADLYHTFYKVIPNESQNIDMLRDLMECFADDSDADNRTLLVTQMDNQFTNFIERFYSPEYRISISAYWMIAALISIGAPVIKSTKERWTKKPS